MLINSTLPDQPAGLTDSSCSGWSIIAVGKLRGNATVVYAVGKLRDHPTVVSKPVWPTGQTGTNCSGWSKIAVGKLKGITTVTDAVGELRDYSTVIAETLFLSQSIPIHLEVNLRMHSSIRNSIVAYDYMGCSFRIYAWVQACRIFLSRIPVDFSLASTRGHSHSKR